MNSEDLKREIFDIAMIGIAKYGGIKQFSDAVGVCRTTIESIATGNYRIKPLTAAKIYYFSEKNKILIFRSNKA